MKSFAIHLEVSRPDAPRERLVVTAARVHVGAGAHCDIRITGRYAMRDHLLLDLVGETLIARAQGIALLRGAPISEVRLADGDELDVAGTRIRVELIPTAAPKRVARLRLATSALVALATFVLPGLVWAALRMAPERPIGPPPSQVTALWDATPTECGVGPDQALALGTRQRAMAELARERHPFAVADGVSAVTTFAKAAACLRRARHDTDASAAARAGDELRARIESDYLVHRVRLEHALEIEDDPTALREVAVLRRLTAGRTGAYVDWLGVVERHVRARTPG